MSEGECVKVVVRCRPTNSREKELKSQKIVKIDRRNLSCSLLRPGEEPKTFTYDNVYDDDSLQKDVYDETAFPLVKSVMEGYNGTIFAYGQTGCGKTFSMEGIRSDPNLRGIIPRSFDQIFEFISTAGAAADKKYLVAVSYVEIYNEEVRDLLSSNPKVRMDVKEDPEKGVFIKNLSQPEVTSVDQIESFMNYGNKNRSVGATAMNATSSRSHSLFTVRVETSETVEGTDEPRIKAGKLNLVDLAGSERQGKTEATGDRLKEAQKINLSLSALGNVISALVLASGKSGKGPEVHIPYRDSKLTRLLQDSLGGNTKTIMIAAVSPANDNYDETLSTLRYANRAKQIKNKPKINEDPKDAMLREFQDEIKRLKAMLESKGLSDDGGNGGGETKRKKKKAAAADESEEEESDEEDAPRVKKVKKVKKPRAAGEVEDLESEEEEEEEVTDESGSVTRRKKSRSGLDSFASPAERKKFDEAKADFDAELAKIQAEKEKHEKFALMLEEQMRVESESLSRIKEQTAAEKAAALAEIEDRLTREKEEHEAKARELEEEMLKSKEEEAAKLVAHEAQIQTLQSEALSQKLALKAKLKKLQQKLMDGGQKAKTAAQEAEEKARLATEEAMALKQAEAKEREAKVALEEANLLLEENYTSIKDEVIGKTKKLKKLKKKYLASVQEVEDSRIEWETEKEGYLTNLRDVYRELKLYKQVAAQILTRSDIEKIVKGSTWIEAKDEWQLPRIDLPVFFPTVRLAPGSASKANAPPAARGASGPRGRASSSAKFQEEKGTDSGWKKSVTAGFDRDEYNPNANGRAVSRLAHQQAAAASQVQKSPSFSSSQARNLDSLGGGSQARKASPDYDPLQTNVARRPAFEGGIVSPHASEEDAHAHLLNMMDSTASRGTFAPDKSQTSFGGGGSPVSSSLSAADIAELDAKVVRKASFAPAAVGVSTPTSDDNFTAALLNSPAKRAAFSPTGAAAVPADDPLAAAAGVPKRSAFEPMKFDSPKGSPVPQTSLPSDLPAARSFQPGGMNTVQQTSVAADILMSHSLPARAAFAPGRMGQPQLETQNAALNFPSAPPRPAFTPAKV